MEGRWDSVESGVCGPVVWLSTSDAVSCLYSAGSRDRIGGKYRTGSVGFASKTN